MIYTAKLNGKFKDKVLVGITTLHKTDAWAVMSNAFAISGIPGKEWFDKFGESYLALVTDMKDGSRVILGFMPVEKSPAFSEDSDRSYIIGTDKFKILIDDKANRCVIDPLDGGEILFGGNGAKEPLILGNKHTELMTELLNGLTSLTVPTPIGTSGVPVNLATFETLKTKLADILSKKVKTI